MPYRQYVTRKQTCFCAARFFIATTLCAGIMEVSGFCKSGVAASLQNDAGKGKPPSPAKNLLAASNEAQIAIDRAVALYNQRNFVSAADAFEKLIKATKPTARLYYYAALANRSAGRIARGKQLFELLTKNYPSTPEASFAQRSFGAGAKSQGPVAELPDIVRNALPKEMQDFLSTAAGKTVVQQALKAESKNLQVVNAATQKGILNKSNTMAVAKAVDLKEAMVTSKAAKVMSKSRAEAPFSSEDIAREGANGIDQSRYPNCWFEASMSALANLPKGQRLIAGMIKYGELGGYVVRFPGDGTDYKVSDETLKCSQVQDKALWASILECAETAKFPNNAGANGPDEEQSRLEVGLGCITGCKAEVVHPANCTIQELSAFTDGAIKSQNPIVAGTFPVSRLGGLPNLIVPLHAYTIIGFDAAKNMVVLRNPHGANSETFDLQNDPRHDEFEQLYDGVFKMSLPLVQKYFSQIARSFI